MDLDAVMNKKFMFLLLIIAARRLHTHTHTHTHTGAAPGCVEVNAHSCRRHSSVNSWLVASGHCYAAPSLRI